MNMLKINNIRVMILSVPLILTFSQSAHAAPSLLWRMTFDSPIVKTSELTDFEVTRDKGPDFPIKTVMTEKSIFVLDSNGEIANKISLKDYDKTEMSGDGTTMATLKGRVITISKIDGEIQGTASIADPQPMVLPQHISFALSPNGEYLIVISNFTHTIYFHNKQGRLLSQYDFEDLKGAEINFSKDSRYAVIHVPNWGEGKTSGYILFFNDRGEKLWRFDHKGLEAKVNLSANGDSIVLAAEDKLYSLNKEGKVIYENELIPGGTDIALSDNGHYVVMTKTTDHSISLLDNKNGKTLWSHSVGNFNLINSPFTSLDISQEGDHIAVAISKDWTKRNKESFLYLFDRAGNMVWENTFEKSRIEGAISPHGSGVLVKGYEDAYLYRK